MYLDECLLKLRDQLTHPLPGAKAHLEMAPEYRAVQFSREQMSGARESAVLILLYPGDDKTHIVLIKRAVSRGAHSGQVSLPGGKREGAEELATTAIRETYEEVGVSPEMITMVGKLTELYIPPSRFIVHPYIGYVTGSVVFTPQPSEVDYVIQVPLQELLNPSIVEEKDIILKNSKEVRTPYFAINGHVVWGATAMVLNELKWLLSTSDRG